MKIKKIFYVANVNLFSGKANAIQLAKMCEALIGQGIDLTLVIPKRLKTQKSVREFYGLSRDISLVRLPFFGFFLQSSIGFNVAAFSFMITSFLFLVWKKVTGEDFLIYTIDLDQFSYAFLPLIAPTVLEVHGSKKKNVFLQFFFARLSGFFAVSEHVRQSIINTFSFQGPSLTLPNGIDLEVFGPERNRAVIETPALERPIFLYSGRAYAWKGIKTIVEALDRNKNLKAVFVGGSKEELESVLHTSVPETLISVGRRPFTEIPSWLAWADVFLVGGTAKDRYSFFETSPMKLFEYLAYGKPIVAVDSPAIREIVNENEVTFFKPDDPADLARAMRFVKEHYSELLKRSEMLKEKAKQYSWKKRVEKVINFMKFLITNF